jgi:hypothetical protein
MSIWPYHSEADLVADGYRRCAHVPCLYCSKELAIFMRPGEMPEFLDAKTYARHLAPPAHLPQGPIDNKSAAAGDR